MMCTYMLISLSLCTCTRLHKCQKWVFVMGFWHPSFHTEGKRKFLVLLCKAQCRNVWPMPGESPEIEAGGASMPCKPFSRGFSALSSPIWMPFSHPHPLPFLQQQQQQKEISKFYGNCNFGKGIHFAKDTNLTKFT